MEASDYYEAYNLNELEKHYSKLLPNSQMHIRDLWEAIYSGNYKSFGKQMYQSCKDHLWGEMDGLKEIMQLFMVLGIVLVIIKYISSLFTESQTMGTAKQAVSILFMTCALSVVMKGISICEDFLIGLTDLSAVVLPIYLISMSLAGSVSMAAAFSQIFAIAMFVLERIILKMLLPLLGTMEVLNVLDDSILEERLHTGISYGEKLVLYVMKGFICGISAFGYVQASVLSATAYVKKTALGSVSALLPGIGKLAEESMDLFWGSTNLIFRCMGNLAGMVLLILCLFPFLKLGVLLLVVRISESFIGLMGEKNMQKGIRITGDAVRLMMRVLFDTVCIFLLTIAIASVSVK